MRCPALADLPPPPPGKTGWPWTEGSPPFPAAQPSGAPWPKIGIVTPSFNQADYLELSIRSVLLQGYPDLDYNIVDGGSTDASVPVIRKYARWLNYWVSEPDKGCSDASAKGLARTNADLLGVMNADDFFARGALATLLALRQAQPNNVLWGGVAPELDQAGQIIKTKQPFVRDYQAIGDWGVGMWSFGVGSLFDGPAYRAIGGFDPRFFNAPDVDLWIRLGQRGTFAFTSETVAFVRHDPASVSRRDELANDVALVASNYLHGQYANANARMVRYIKMWLPTLKTRPLPGRDTAASLLAQAPATVLAKALALRLARSARAGCRKILGRAD